MKRYSLLAFVQLNAPRRPDNGVFINPGEPTTGTENGGAITANKSGLAHKRISLLVRGICYLFVPDALKLGNRLHRPPSPRVVRERGVWGWRSRGAAAHTLHFPDTSDH